MPSIIRYPGSKAKLTGSIRDTLPDWMKSGNGLFPTPAGSMYVEPFFGSGAAGLDILKHVKPDASVWINDLDYAMYAVWYSVLNKPTELVRRVREFQPTVEAFYELKRIDGTRGECVTLDALNKIALHRMSVSGFGRMSGGPIGGRSQGGDYTVGCRWAPASIEQAIREANHRLSGFREIRLTNLHVRDVLAECDSSCFIYLDPPYYVKGGQLYAHNMGHDEHAELAEMLRNTPSDWRLSYDDCPQIREMYSWAYFKELEITYTNAVTRDIQRPKNREVLISPSGAAAMRGEGVGYGG